MLFRSAAILDLDVPGAEELAEEIEELMPVINLTTSGRQRAGKNTLIKPFSKDGILFALQEALAPPRHKKMRPASSKSMHSDLSILLAEDNPVNQKVARLMLKKLGYRADLACNGREVLQSISNKNYDVILMDVQMPEMDGLEATRAILDLNLKKRPKILAMTAYALDGDKERCLLAGMDGYISKPVQLDELRSACHACKIPQVMRIRPNETAFSSWRWRAAEQGFSGSCLLRFLAIFANYSSRGLLQLRHPLQIETKKIVKKCWGLTQLSQTR